LEKASKICEIQLKDGIPHAFKDKFLKLPDTVEKLDTDIHQCEAISQCGSEVDEGTVAEFNRRKAEIERLRTLVERDAGKLDKHRSNYEATKNDWIDKVEAMIAEINEKFQTLFRQLRCAGEISLGRPDNAEEFAKYGITIKVSFRSDEQLQELTAWQQSGGEKSVSTMMYMIALQEMTKCPFRVVDEINQVFVFSSFKVCEIRNSTHSFRSEQFLYHCVQSVSKPRKTYLVK
jgi:chromosome segregation ATPase